MAIPDAYWIPHAVDTWVPATRKDAQKQLYKHIISGEEFVCPQAGGLSDEVWTPQVKDLEKMHDICWLPSVSEGALLHAIRERYAKKHIYTYVLRTLIAVNPFSSELPIYGADYISKYRRGNIEALEPHIFALTKVACQTMKDRGIGQAVLISGESGAGKTESAKKVLDFVSKFESAQTLDADARSLGTTSVLDQVIHTNTVLEAFGNAKTVRNDNSSRFGKWLDMCFSKVTHMTECCRLQHFLLETTRVTAQAEGERGYHIFHQLINNRHSSLESMKTLKPSAPVGYIQRPREKTRVDDVADFRDLQVAMEELGFHEDGPLWASNDIFNVVAGILLMGNIALEGKDDRSSVKDIVPLKICAGLLGVEASSLEEMLVKRIFQAPMSAPLLLPNTAQKAKDTRDGLARAFYNWLFEGMIGQMNSLLNGDTYPEMQCALGILDIAGFECFKVNGLEQLLINLSNETLQQRFNQDVFKSEEEECRREGLEELKYPGFPDNDNVLALLSGSGAKGDALLVLFNEDTTLLSYGNKTDKTFTEKINTIFASEEKYPSFVSKLKDPKTKQTMFGIKHFAGIVEYTTEGWLEKNSDSVPANVSDLLKSSTNDVVRELGMLASGQKTKVKTVCSNFSKGLHDLMALISQRSTHYVRCIKPNERQEAWQFEPAMVMNQLKYSGILAAVHVRQMCYPNKIGHANFVREFGVVVERFGDERAREAIKACNDDSARARAVASAMPTAIVARFGANGADAFENAGIFVGCSRVLIKLKAMEVMKRGREEALKRVVIHIQSVYRGYRERVNYCHMRIVLDQIKSLFDKIDLKTFSRKASATKVRQRSVSTLHHSMDDEGLLSRILRLVSSSAALKKWAKDAPNWQRCDKVKFPHDFAETNSDFVRVVVDFSLELDHVVKEAAKLLPYPNMVIEFVEATWAKDRMQAEVSVALSLCTLFCNSLDVDIMRSKLQEADRFKVPELFMEPMTRWVSIVQIQSAICADLRAAVQDMNVETSDANIGRLKVAMEGFLRAGITENDWLPQLVKTMRPAELVQEALELFLKVDKSYAVDLTTRVKSLVSSNMLNGLLSFKEEQEKRKRKEEERIRAAAAEELKSQVAAEAKARREEEARRERAAAEAAAAAKAAKEEEERQERLRRLEDERLERQRRLEELERLDRARREELEREREGMRKKQQAWEASKIEEIKQMEERFQCEIGAERAKFIQLQRQEKEQRDSEDRQERERMAKEFAATREEDRRRIENAMRREIEVEKLEIAIKFDREVAQCREDEDRKFAQKLAQIQGECAEKDVMIQRVQTARQQSEEALKQRLEEVENVFDTQLNEILSAKAADAMKLQEEVMKLEHLQQSLQKQVRKLEEAREAAERKRLAEEYTRMGFEQELQSSRKAIEIISDLHRAELDLLNKSVNDQVRKHTEATALLKKEIAEEKLKGKLTESLAAKKIDLLKAEHDTITGETKAQLLQQIKEAEKEKDVGIARSVGKIDELKEKLARSEARNKLEEVWKLQTETMSRHERERQVLHDVSEWSSVEIEEADEHGDGGGECKKDNVTLSSLQYQLVQEKVNAQLSESVTKNSVLTLQLQLTKCEPEGRLVICTKMAEANEKQAEAAAQRKRNIAAIEERIKEYVPSTQATTASREAREWSQDAELQIVARALRKLIAQEKINAELAESLACNGILTLQLALADAREELVENIKEQIELAEREHEDVAAQNSVKIVALEEQLAQHLAIMPADLSKMPEVESRQRCAQNESLRPLASESYSSVRIEEIDEIDEIDKEIVSTKTELVKVAIMITNAKKTESNAALALQDEIAMEFREDMAIKSDQVRTMANQVRRRRTIPGLVVSEASQVRRGVKTASDEYDYEALTRLLDRAREELYEDVEEEKDPVTGLGPLEEGLQRVQFLHDEEKLQDELPKLCEEANVSMPTVLSLRRLLNIADYLRGTKFTIAKKTARDLACQVQRAFVTMAANAGQRSIAENKDPEVVALAHRCFKNLCHYGGLREPSDWEGSCKHFLQPGKTCAIRRTTSMNSEATREAVQKQASGKRVRVLSFAIPEEDVDKGGEVEQEQMLMHTSQYIAGSLCKAPKEIEKAAFNELATNAFVNLVVFMGEKPAQGLQRRACREALLQQLKETPLLANEVYVQIMKQVHCNPNPASSSIAWELMKDLRGAAPPCPVLAEFIRAFVLNHEAEIRGMEMEPGWADGVINICANGTESSWAIVKALFSGVGTILENLEWCVVPPAWSAALRKLT